MFNIDISGDKELIAVLSSLSKSEFKTAMQFAAKKSLEPVRRKAQSIAPKKTGRLSKAIRIRVLKKSRVRVGARVVVGSNDSMFRGRTFYGAFQEYGWRAGRRANNQDLGVAKRKRRTAAQREQIEQMNAARPQIQGKFYLKKAVHFEKKSVMSSFMNEIRGGIHKALNRSASRRAKEAAKAR